MARPHYGGPGNGKSGPDTLEETQRKPPDRRKEAHATYHTDALALPLLAGVPHLDDDAAVEAVLVGLVAPLPRQVGRVPGVLGVHEDAARARVDAAVPGATPVATAALRHRGRVARLHHLPAAAAAATRGHRAPREALHGVGDGRPQRVAALGGDPHRLRVVAAPVRVGVGRVPPQGVSLAQPLGGRAGRAPTCGGQAEG